jgi:hypothetical protein
MRAEFEEIPDLQLTRAQAQQLWGLDSVVTEGLLDALVAAGFLKTTRRGTYVRA